MSKTESPKAQEGSSSKPARPAGAPHSDDSLMERFELQGLNRFRARDALIATGLITLVLLLFAGGSVRSAADRVDPGIGRDILKAAGEPTGWVSDQLPFSDVRDDLTSWLSPDAKLGAGGFADGGRAEFVPGTVPETGELGTLLVTGDSLSTPLDTELARALADTGVEVVRDPHLGTGISNTGLVDWGRLSSGQAAQHSPDAVVIFIGANEGYSMDRPGGGQVSCCGPDWARVYGDRVGKVMENYLSGGVSRIYWLTVPTPRDAPRAEIEQIVNDAIRKAAAPFGEAVRIIDTVATFTPGDRYRDTIEIEGDQTLVRESDGIHLNEAGSALEAEIVLQAVDEEFDF